jgi:hypothetical protein
VALPDDPTRTTAPRTREVRVLRIEHGRYVLQVGDEIRTCAERDLAEALRQSLGLGYEDAGVLADTVRADARRLSGS